MTHETRFEALYRPGLSLLMEAVQNPGQRSLEERTVQVQRAIDSLFLANLSMLDDDDLCRALDRGLGYSNESDFDPTDLPSGA